MSRITAGCALCVLLLASTEGRAQDWSPTAPMSTARSMLRLETVGPIVFAIGGEQAGPLTTVEAYDPVANVWTSRAPMSTARSQFGSGVIGGRIYVAGGRDAGSSCESYDPGADVWTSFTSLPSGLVEMASAVADEKLYLFGGQDYVGGAAVATVLEYDPVAGTWQSRAAMPHARKGAKAVTLGDKILVIGGHTRTIGVNDATPYVDVYDPVNDTWAPGINLPVSLTEPAVALLDDVVFVAGGAVQEWPHFSDDVYTLRPGDTHWSAGDSLPAVIFAPAATVVGGCILVGGGIGDTTNFTYSPTVYKSGSSVCPEPTAPTGLAVANPGTSTSLDVSWNPVEGAASYVLSRSATGVAEYTQDVTGTSVRDLGLNAGTTYTYTVRAENACDVLGPNSGTASGTPNFYPVLLVPGINAGSEAFTSHTEGLSGRGAGHQAGGSSVARLVPQNLLYATRSLLGDVLANLDNKKNLRVYVVDFGKSGKLDRPVDQALPLADAIDAVMDETGEQHVNLVAHSMGGLSSRYLIQVGDPAYAHRVANLVMIGTPNHGSDLALQLYIVGLRENLIGGQKLTGDQKAVLSMVKELARSRALPDLAPQSVFLNSLNYGDDNSRYDSGDACDPGHRPELIPSAGGTQYWTIAGTGDCEDSFFNWFMGILGIDTEACESDGVVPVSSVRLQSVDATHHALDTELSGNGGLLAAHIADLTAGWGCWDFVGELQHPGIISATLSILTTGSMSTISSSALAEESIAAERRPARTAEAPEFAAKAFPNPAPRNVTVQFAVPWAAPVSLRLYDPAGRLVRVLVDQWMPAGEKSVVWDRITDAGRTAGAGVYFYELRAGDRNTAKKLLLLR